MKMSVKEHNSRKRQTYKLILWFAMLSMVMMFAGLTSAYIVSTSRPDWMSQFNMPKSFFLSSIVIIVSSISIHLAKSSIKKDNRLATTVWLLVTLALGLLFAYLQYQGLFKEFVSQGLYLTGASSNITVSFIYIVIFAHFLHLFGGLVALLVIIYNHYKQKYSSSQFLGIELGAMYWHFLDFLWIALFLFFYFY